ncbi:integrase [Oleiphilus sp. HI0071]|nr:integrase [Oleiphilus sp. HI0065]KZY90004.1 integrase [Oleiphilus sp. HI0071]KZY90144.1 integrase [Oleiphilus sp. HI0073]KZZ49661.1 integrase [Oleiphilus sp. HI0122]
MGSIRTRGAKKQLYIDFRFEGKRYREATGLSDTPKNRAKVESKLEAVEEQIASGEFEYGDHFGKPEVVTGKTHAVSIEPAQPAVSVASSNHYCNVSFEEFFAEWLQENKVLWRNSHVKNIESMQKRYYLPYFGKRGLAEIARADILKFRSFLATQPGRGKNKTLSNNRINKVLDPLKRVFEEASDRYQIPNAYVRIKPLKIRKSDVQPFTLTEVSTIINKVRKDYKNYYTVRFFTGLRTGEIDGLKWKYVDFERRQLLVRETVVDGEEEYTKTDYSQRTIDLSGPVYNALLDQKKATGHLSQYVFCNLNGEPLEHNNVTKRIWYPLLERLGLDRRRPYQSRHTAATLWLAAGESPEWIASQMGHANTEMLFKVYSRFVPNLTRRDGSAFEKLVQEHQDKNS